MLIVENVFYTNLFRRRIEMKKNLLKKAIISLALITTIVGGVSSMNGAKA